MKTTYISQKFRIFLAYLKARFPVIPLFLYTSVTAAGIASTVSSKNYILVATMSVIYLLFLFHLRILDEFKDYRYDAKFHQDRPVQKGIISLMDLKIIGVINVLISIVLVILFINISVSILLLMAYLYTFLMFKEFFVGRWLKKRIVLYLISHEVVFVPLFLFFFSALNGQFWRIDSISSLAVFVYVILPVLIIEIGRKIPHRFDKKGRKTDDTYSYTWGEQNTIRIFSSIIIIAGLLGLCISHFNFLAAISIIFSGIMLSVMSYKHYKIVVKYNILIITLFALGLPLCLLI